MSKQCLDIEQMQHLHELGLDTSKASMQYIENNNGKILCIPKEIEHDIKDVEDGYIICDALTLPDIIDLLPSTIEGCELEIYKVSVCYFDYESSKLLIYKVNQSLIDAAYEMLCWCVEKRLYTNRQIILKYEH